MDNSKIKINLGVIKPKFEIYEADNNKTLKSEYYWRIKVGRNIIASSSEGYRNRSECLENVFNIERKIKYLRENDLIK
jgi:uncharacterized protein YegP (UPF0339 family)